MKKLKRFLFLMSVLILILLEITIHYEVRVHRANVIKESDICNCQPSQTPICGTDGVTYLSECDANCAGVSIAHQGKCQQENELVCGDGTCDLGETETDCPQDCTTPPIS